MTPLQLVRAECANYESNGTCLGAKLGDDGSITSCTPRPSCLLAEGKRCLYFEECVAPMQHVVTEPRRAAEIQAAVRDYRRQTQQGDEILRECPDCGCAVVWRKRYCPACTENRRKATYRESKREIRKNGIGMSTVKPEKPSKTLGNSHGFAGTSQNPYQDSGHPQNWHLTVDTGAMAGRRAGP